MRTCEQAEAAWSAFTKHGSLITLRRAIQDTPDELNDAAIRSISWKAFLLGNTLDTAKLLSTLQESRDAYTDLRHRFMRGLQNPDELDSFADPLSEDSNSPWTALRSDEALRQEIQRDVDRCMPDNLYFRQPATQNMLLDILFVWSKLNQDVSYRQGMHEVLAPVVWAIERDAVDLALQSTNQQDSPSSATSEQANIAFDAKYIEHDSFTLFNVIMQNVKSAYDTTPAVARAGPAMTSRSAARAEPPMVLRSRKIMDIYLDRVDPPLAAHLQEIEILPQVFLMRWIRLLFGREFTFDQTLTMWDNLFAQDPTLNCLDLICASMLLRIRWQLIDADYNNAMTILLKYPPFSSGQHPSSLINDAIYLQTHLDFDGGYHVIGKQTKRPPPLINRPSASTLLHQRTPSDLYPQQDSPSRPGSTLRVPSGLEGLVQDAARSVFARSEKLGLNKAVRDAVGEMKKNLQPPISRLHSRSTSVINDPLDTSASHDIMQRVEALEQRNKQLAKMLEGAIDDLWIQHKEVVENRPVEDERTKAFTMAIAKVQFASVYLEDSSLPLPQQEVEASARSSAGSGETSRDDASTNVTAPAINEKPDIAVAPAPKTKDPPSASKSSGNSAASRPSLEQSSFSWMLGQGTTEKMSARSAFMSASPFTVREGPGGRSNGFLFGDEDDAEATRKGSDASLKDKKSKKDKSRAKEAEPDDEVVKLGTMSRR